MTIEITTIGTRELWEQFQKKPLDIYADAVRKLTESKSDDPPTLSRALEEISPSEDGDELDAFGRLMREAGIIPQTDMRAGYQASPAIRFFETPGSRALYTEFFARTWRKVTYGNNYAQVRATLLSEDSIIGSWERPWADATAPRADRLVEPAIPLSELVAQTTPVSGDAWRSYYLIYDEEQLRKFRVGESAEIPVARIDSKQHEVRLFKTGRGLEMSYEVARRLPVDKLARFIQWQAVQSEMDKVAAALDVLVNGDGNANTAATVHDLTDLDPNANPGELSIDAWLALDFEFEQPYSLTTALMRKNVALMVAKLNVGSANLPLGSSALAGVNPMFTLINRRNDNYRYGHLASAPADQIVAFDNRVALGHMTEIGATISEMERFVSRQTTALYMTETDGFEILDSNSVHILDLETPG